MRDLRKKLGLTHREAAKRAGVSHGSIQNLEARGLDGISFGMAIKIASAYGVTLANLKRINEGLDALPDNVSESLKRLEVHPDWVAIPVYGSVSAGDMKAQPLEDNVAYVPRQHLARRGANVDNVVCYVVNGNCMISPEAMRVDRTFAPGDYVAVDPSKAPQAGDVVVAWWEEREIMVIKRFGLEEEAIVLTPISPGYPNVVLPAHAHTHIIGPVVWRGG